jgi:predicted dehydrogenase
LFVAAAAFKINAVTMTRRAFIFAAGTTLSAQTPPSRQIVVGLIGAGARGSELLRSCLADPSIRIGAICETFEPRMFEAVALARSNGSRTRYYRIYADLLADKDLDAVIIATPDFWHARMTLEAIDAGKDVYLEQPPSLTWQESVAMAASEHDSRQIVQVGSQVRSSRLAADWDPARLGRIRIAHAHRNSDCLRPRVLHRGGFKLPEPLNFVDWQAAAAKQVPYSPDRFVNWRFYSMYGDGIVSDLGFPTLDAIDCLSGAGFPVTVQASGFPSPEEGFDTTERAAIAVRYSRMLASVSLDGSAPQVDESLRLIGEAGEIELGPAIRSGAPDATRRHLAKFFEAVRSRKPTNATIGSTLPASLVYHMANLSISSGRTVHWDGAASSVSVRG